MLESADSIIYYGPTDFAGLGGNVIVTNEAEPPATTVGTLLVQFNPVTNAYDTTVFDPTFAATINEGAKFAECDAPTPSPTPTPTATSTPTSTLTSTPTSTPMPGGGCQESTSISGNLNAFAIASGNYLWFSSVLKANHLPSNAVVHVTFTNQMISIPGFGSINVPDSTVTFDPAAVSATTSFAGTWMTTVPSNPKGNTFFAGHSVQVPGGLPGSAHPVTWSGTITVDTPGVSVNWQWAAANYPGAHFSANDGALGVKSVDDNKLDPLYQNSDHAGTPENFKQFVVGGGTGGGGSNFTGSYSSTASVCR